MIHCSDSFIGNTHSKGPPPPQIPMNLIKQLLENGSGGAPGCPGEASRCTGPGLRRGPCASLGIQCSYCFAMNLIVRSLHFGICVSLAPPRPRLRSLSSVFGEVNGVIRRSQIVVHP